MSCSPVNDYLNKGVITEKESEKVNIDLLATSIQEINKEEVMVVKPPIIKNEISKKLK